MHRKVLPLILFVFSAGFALAQPNLTSNENYTIFQKSLLYSVDSTGPGSSGANVTWDFSALSYNAIDTYYYSPCSQSTACATFPGTDVYNHQNGNPASVYWATSSSALSIIGEYTNSAIVFSNPEDMLRYPFTYNSTYTDPYAASFVSAGYTYYRNGNITVTGDGYGTLILPNGTFTNALRVKRTEVYGDSTNISGVPFTINYQSNIYAWYIPNHPEILMGITDLYVDGTHASTTVYYSASLNLAVQNTENTGASFNVYPNPASTALHISFTTKDNDQVKLSMINILGQEVIQTTNNYQSGTQQIDLNTSGLAKGLYIVRLQTGTESFSKKVEIQ